jgi:hypothetical protein
MMTDEQKSRVAELKSAIAAATTADGAPREVRVAAVSLKGSCVGRGRRRALAGAVSVHESTLCRWKREVGGGLTTRGEVGDRGKRRGR